MDLLSLQADSTERVLGCVWGVEVEGGREGGRIEMQGVCMHVRMCVFVCSGVCC